MLETATGYVVIQHKHTHVWLQLRIAYVCVTI
jgi:hypothetical protein